MRFIVFSPTIIDWLVIMRTQREKLLNPSKQMNVLLEETREDIEMQFDENQSKWKPLRPFTLDKKKKARLDNRILHETVRGTGLRLREAYAKAGKVEADGTLVYTYPEEKPHAKINQEGGEEDNPTRFTIRSRERAEKINRDLDDEFDRKFKFDR